MCWCLLTDGEDHSGEEMKALGSRLQAAGVKTHLVAVGSDLGEPVPDGAGGYLRDRQGRPVVSRTDRDGLEAMQKASGGMCCLACSQDRPLRIGSGRDSGAGSPRRAPLASRAPTTLVSGVIGWSLVARRVGAACAGSKQRFG